MAIDQIDPPRAKALQDEGSTYLDVRSVPEFEQGHAPGAVNIPLLHFDPAAGMQPNPDFLAVCEAALTKDQKLVVGCAAGGRSQKACDLLASNGFTSLANIQGGFGGMRDPSGNLAAKGWQQHELPVSTEATDEQAYAALAKKAGR